MLKLKLQERHKKKKEKLRSEKNAEIEAAKKAEELKKQQED